MAIHTFAAYNDYLVTVALACHGQLAKHVKHSFTIGMNPVIEYNIPEACVKFMFTLWLGYT